jgi:AcrR family transcriptional regulator
VAPQQRALETRAKILAAAVERFSRHGYDATGVAAICEEAGVSKGAFYHHFPGKQALFLALLEEWLSGLDARMAMMLEGAPSVSEGLLAMAGVMPSIFADARGRIPLFLEFWIQASRDPEVWKATVAPYRRYRNYFSSLISAGISQGSLTPVNPDVAAAIMVSFAVGLLVQGAVDTEGADWGTAAREGMRILLDSMQPSRG